MRYPELLTGSAQQPWTNKDGVQLASSIANRLKMMLAIGGIAGSIFSAFLLGSPPGAQASLSEYCANAHLAGHGLCTGASRTLYAVFGWGEQHAVCVGVNQTAKSTCSGGPK